MKEDMMKGKAKELMQHFHHTKHWTFDELLEVQVPSIYFPNRKVLQETLSYCLKNGYLVVNHGDRYSEAKIPL